MNIYEAILARRTIRKFKQEEIDISILKKLVNAARLAPSGGNIQPLEYFIVSDPKLKDKIFPTLQWAGYIKPYGNPREGEKPAAYIVILVNKDLAVDSNYKYDIGASAENITLTALQECIGCCWIGSFNKKRLTQILNIPDNYVVDLVIAIGYPAEEPVVEEITPGASIKYYKDSSGTLHVPKRKVEDIIHINSF